MHFGYLILYVNDVESTISAYEKAFGLVRGMVTETGEYGELVTGDTKLAFARASFVQSSLPGAFEPVGALSPPMEIGLVAVDVAAAFARAVDSGFEAVKPPELKPWGQTVAYVRDSNRFLVEICTPVP